MLSFLCVNAHTHTHTVDAKCVENLLKDTQELNQTLVCVLIQIQILYYSDEDNHFITFEKKA